MKPKRLLALLMAVVTVVSVFTISASAANTEDTYYTYSWKSNSRYDYTPTRKKMNATPVYLKTQEYTLPYNGYYAKTLQNIIWHKLTERESLRFGFGVLD